MFFGVWLVQTAGKIAYLTNKYNISDFTYLHVISLLRLITSHLCKDIV
jgi:hypothetical protein